MVTSTPVFSYEVTTRDLAGLPDARGDSIKGMLASDHGVEVAAVRVILGYQVKADLTSEEAERAVYDLFADPVIERGSVNSTLLNDSNIFSNPPHTVIQAGFKPGVTDNAGQAGLDVLLTLFPRLKAKAAVATNRTYLFWGVPDGVTSEWLASKLHNPMIERAATAGKAACSASNWPNLDFPEQPSLEQQNPAVVDLEVSDEKLLELSDTGLLALNLEEMKAIQSHYRDPQVQSTRKELGLPVDAPTDAELECLAQTWSEHCSHKIFAANIHHIDTETGEDSTIDSLFKTHIMKPTLDIQSNVDWLLSIFHDNSGVIAWNDDWSLCMKAETHNSPSALDPFGGAMTGIVGVNRDILGTGLGARPIANTDVFCFGPPDYSGKIPEGLFHPSRVFRGVHAGVRAGGNESGIPTVNGAIIFDERYLGKP
ncbi:MAG: AIR synthase related protein, partial [Candidatus Poseidoniaceae archaeon]|nr:AIR synthase related protein [Candidatus Poseidoniaceae archaeon]